jgi:hypothetical protein
MATTEHGYDSGDDAPTSLKAVVNTVEAYSAADHYGANCAADTPDI